MVAVPPVRSSCPVCASVSRAAKQIAPQTEVAEVLAVARRVLADEEELADAALGDCGLRVPRAGPCGPSAVRHLGDVASACHPILQGRLEEARSASTLRSRPATRQDRVLGGPAADPARAEAQRSPGLREAVPRTPHGTTPVRGYGWAIP